MFIKNFSDKHFRLGARTWTAPDRDEIYRQRYLASAINSSNHTKSSQTNPTPLHDSPDSPPQHYASNHQSVSDHHPPSHGQVAPTRSRTTSLHQPLNSHSSHLNPDSSSLLSRSRSHKTLGNSQKAPSLIPPESLHDTNPPFNPLPSVSRSQRGSQSQRRSQSQRGSQSQRASQSQHGPDSIHQPHPNSHLSQNLSISQPIPLPTQSILQDHYQLDTASYNARQSRNEYTASCAVSDYGREKLREAQQGLEIAQERLRKAKDALKRTQPELSTKSEYNQSEHDLPLKYNNPELNHALGSNHFELGGTTEHHPTEINNVLESNHLEFANTPQQQTLKIDNALESTHLELANPPNLNTPRLDHNPESLNSQRHHHFSNEILLRQSEEQAELHAQKLEQIHQENRAQAEQYEKKLTQIRELETLLAIKEQDVESRVKQLEEALELERAKCQEYTLKAQQLEDTLEAERLKCKEQIEIAQETANRAARESIQRAEEERQRKCDEILKESEEKQQAARRQYEAECKKLEQAQLKLEAEHKEEKRKEAETRMLEELERMRIEDQARLDLEAQTIAREKDRLAIRAQIEERDRVSKKPLAHPDRRRAELIASFQPIDMWNFDTASFQYPYTSPTPPDYLPPFYPSTPMSPHIVPEAVKKAARAQQEYCEKLQRNQKIKEETRQMMLESQKLQDEPSARFELEKRRTYQNTAPDHLGHEQNQAQFPRSLGSPQMGYPNSIPNLRPQPQSTDKARSSSQHADPAIIARELELARIEALARKDEQIRRIEDALIAKNRAALEAAAQKAMSSGNSEVGSHLSQKAEDASDAQTRAAEVAAHFMAEQASSKPSGRTKSHSRGPSNGSVVAHGHSQSNSTRPPFELTSQSGTSFYLHFTDHVPGYDHEVVKEIESSVVLGVDQPCPIDYLKNDQCGQEYRIRSEWRTRQALVATAEGLGANAIICLSHPAPVLVDHPRVNFSARGVAVKLKNPSAVPRAGLDNSSPHSFEVDSGPHPSHHASEPPPIPHPHKTPATPMTVDSELFGNSESDTQSISEARHLSRSPSAHRSPVSDNQKAQKSIDDSGNGVESSSPISNGNRYNPGCTSPGANLANPSSKTPGHVHREHRSPRVIEEGKCIRPRVSERAPGLPIPPAYWTPKVTLQSPSEKSSLNESNENGHLLRRNHSGPLSPTSARPPDVKKSTKSSGLPKISAHESGGQNLHSVSGAEKPSLNTSSPRASAKTDSAVTTMCDESWDRPASNTDIGSLNSGKELWGELSSLTNFGTASDMKNMDCKKSSPTLSSTQSPIPSLCQMMRQLSQDPQFHQYDLFEDLSSFPQGGKLPYGKSDSINDTFSREDDMMEDETENSIMPEPTLTKNLICYDSVRVNQSGFPGSPQKTCEDVKQFTDVMHSSSSAKKCASEASSQVASAIKTKKLSDKPKQHRSVKATNQRHPQVSYSLEFSNIHA